MRQSLIALLMLLTTSANALELELGVGKTENPFYREVNCETLPDRCENKTIGKIALYHTFNIEEWVGIKLWIDHYSLLGEPEVNPNNHGRNMAGASVVFKLF